ncbi:hypothetical protein HT105_23270, partial [Bacteroides fragilis]|nr:hypothetical protein [Bacteroides fragilis]
SEKLKGLAGASGTSALFGITEPAIFGVNLRLRWPFYIGMAASAVASTLIAIFDVKATAAMANIAQGGAALAVYFLAR